jgi:predicted nucleotidyltransferase
VKHGLDDKHLSLIKGVLSAHTSAIDKVALFGSRATGAYRPQSDIDLVLYGDIPESTVDRLWTNFQESALPYKVDVIAYQQLGSPALKRHIDQFAVPLFSHQQLYGNSVAVAINSTNGQNHQETGQSSSANQCH